SHRQELPIPKPVNHQEKVAYVLAALDQTSLLEPSAQELFMLKLKRTWSQYKYRHTGEAKKQVYMPLGEEARALLDELAERADTPRYKVVEQLVREAHAKINDN
ncbi:MAG: hypothetical protein R3292_14760, partial [Alcanivorax sp.]|nr:hypothetical protein [Alcanivorax sp.]